MLFFHFYVVSRNSTIRAKNFPCLEHFAIKQAKKTDPQFQNCQENLFWMLCLYLQSEKGDGVFEYLLLVKCRGTLESYASALHCMCTGIFGTGACVVSKYHPD